MAAGLAARRPALGPPPRRTGARRLRQRQGRGRAHAGPDARARRTTRGPSRRPRRPGPLGRGRGQDAGCAPRLYALATRDRARERGPSNLAAADLAVPSWRSRDRTPRGARIQPRRGPRAAASRAARTRPASQRLGLGAPARPCGSRVTSRPSWPSRRRQSPPQRLGHVRAGLADLHAWQSVLRQPRPADQRRRARRAWRCTGSAARGVGSPEPGAVRVVGAGPRPGQPGPPVRPSGPAWLRPTSPSPAHQRGRAGRPGPPSPRTPSFGAGSRERAQLAPRGRRRWTDPVCRRSTSGPRPARPRWSPTSSRRTGLVALVVTAGVTDGRPRSRGPPRRAARRAAADLDVAPRSCPPRWPRRSARSSPRARRLAGLLVAPLLPVLGDRDVVLTPSGVLAGTPWTLLPGLHGRPVTVAQSATTWLARRTTPLRTATAGLVAGPRVARGGRGRAPRPECGRR